MVGESRTVLFSTHITSDLERVADRVAVLKDGKIVYSGELDALKDSVKRLHIQAAPPLPNGSFRVPGMLQAKVTGNEAVVSVKDFTPDLDGTNRPTVVGVRCSAGSKSRGHFPGAASWVITCGSQEPT